MISLCYNEMAVLVNAQGHALVDQDVLLAKGYREDDVLVEKTRSHDVR